MTATGFRNVQTRGKFRLSSCAGCPSAGRIPTEQPSTRVDPVENGVSKHSTGSGFSTLPRFTILHCFFRIMSELVAGNLDNCYSQSLLFNHSPNTTD